MSNFITAVTGLAESPFVLFIVAAITVAIVIDCCYRGSSKPSRSHNENHRQ